MSERCSSEVDEEVPEGAARAAIRPSRASRWRLWVLVAVHVAIAAHVAHWWFTGSTLTPLEPSESIEFSSRGVLNAGAVFFALSILITALVGRFFCGWACHLVAVQDGCRWLLEKAGMRPRPVQLGVLGLVPWLVFVYMFLAPWLARLESELGLGVTATEFVTAGFWDTFPGLAMALLTLTVAGFAMVWFLGAKGFCTYACPYGAAFGIADQLAPLRIRVTDACEGCGHCTAVCTSNVRVHQEVRDFKAVVDPGCMKCLDCVSVCPKDALYVGFGAPALATARVREPAGRRAAWGERALRVLIAAAFLWCGFVVLLSRQGTLETRWATELALGSLVVALLFAGKAERRGGPSAAEDLLLGAVFLVSLFGLRGYHLIPGVDEGVPLLLALGLAVLFACAALLAARAFTRSELALQSWALVRAGRLTSAGRGFAFACLPIGALVGHAGWTQLREIREAREQREQAAARLAEARAAYDRGVAHAQSGRFDPARAEFERALELAPEFLEARENLAGMYCALGRFPEGIAHYLEALRVRPDDPDTHFLIGQAYLQTADRTSAEEHWRSAIRLKPDHAAAHMGLAVLCEERGDLQGARDHEEAARRADAGSR